MKIQMLVMLHAVFLSSFAQLAPVPSGVVHWKDLTVTKENEVVLRQILKGTTAEFDYFELYASTLEKGKGLPTVKDDELEELYIIKEGTGRWSIGGHPSILGKGSVVLLPPQESLTIENVGKGPLTFYVVKFRSNKGMNKERSRGALALNYDSLNYTETPKKGTRKYFDRPTAMCEQYEMHITYLKEKGPSHSSHQHKDTEIILVIEGEAEMTIDGQYSKGAAGDLFIIESGKMHGVGNPSDRPCSYFAFKWK